MPYFDISKLNKNSFQLLKSRTYDEFIEIYCKYFNENFESHVLFEDETIMFMDKVCIVPQKEKTLHFISANWYNFCSRVLIEDKFYMIVFINDTEEELLSYFIKI